MSDESNARARVELRIGEVSFSGEGDQAWLDGQITKLLQATCSNQVLANDGGTPSTGPMARVPLPSYLKALGGSTTQVKRFLATAAWLHRRGVTSLTTKAVTTALRDSLQRRLSNASDCLNKNVSKGFCEKTAGGAFFITQEGWDALGEQPQ